MLTEIILLFLQIEFSISQVCQYYLPNPNGKKINKELFNRGLNVTIKAPGIYWHQNANTNDCEFLSPTNFLNDTWWLSADPNDDFKGCCSFQRNECHLAEGIFGSALEFVAQTFQDCLLLKGKIDEFSVSFDSQRNAYILDMIEITTFTQRRNNLRRQPNLPVMTYSGQYINKNWLGMVDIDVPQNHILFTNP